MVLSISCSIPKNTCSFGARSTPLRSSPSREASKNLPPAIPPIFRALASAFKLAIYGTLSREPLFQKILRVQTETYKITNYFNAFLASKSYVKPKIARSFASESAESPAEAPLKKHLTVPPIHARPFSTDRQSHRLGQ